MGVLELWIAAETSSDLQHHEKDCHVDVLGAVGMAAQSDGHLAIYRLKYMNDLDSLRVASAQFIHWTRKSLVRRKIRMNSTTLGKRILLSWVNDTCETCKGRGYISSTRLEAVIDKKCGDCNGIGKSRVEGNKNEIIVSTDVVEKADLTIDYLTRNITKKLDRNRPKIDCTSG